MNGTETDERPHHSILRLQKSATEFYRAFREATQNRGVETVKAFRRHYSEKPVIFRGRVARCVQQTSNKLTNFLGDLLQLALKSYPDEYQ